MQGDWVVLWEEACQLAATLGRRSRGWKGEDGNQALEELTYSGHQALIFGECRRWAPGG